MTITRAAAACALLTLGLAAPLTARDYNLTKKWDRHDFAAEFCRLATKGQPRDREQLERICLDGFDRCEQYKDTQQVIQCYRKKQGEWSQ